MLTSSMSCERRASALINDCSNCINACAEDSRRRQRLMRNGYCPQWQYRGSKEPVGRAILFFESTYNARHVYGERDGMRAEWGSINKCASYFGKSPRSIRNYISEGTVVDGWRLSFEKKATE